MYRSAEFLSDEIPVHHCVELPSTVTVNNFDLLTESILSIPTEEKNVNKQRFFINYMNTLSSVFQYS